METFPIVPCWFLLCRRYPSALISFLRYTGLEKSICHLIWYCKRVQRPKSPSDPQKDGLHSKGSNTKMHTTKKIKNKYLSNLRSFANRFLLVASSTIPSLMDLPNSFQNLVYWPFFSLSSPDLSTSAHPSRFNTNQTANQEKISNTSRSFNNEQEQNKRRESKSRN